MTVKYHIARATNYFILGGVVSYCSEELFILATIFVASVAFFFTFGAYPGLLYMHQNMTLACQATGSY